MILSIFSLVYCVSSAKEVYKKQEVQSKMNLLFKKIVELPHKELQSTHTQTY